MIKVLAIDTESGRELAHIDIELLDEDGQFADYSVRFGVNKGTSVSVHQRGVLRFPYRRYNALALLLQALKTLDEVDLEYDSFWDEAEARAQSTLRKLRELLTGETPHDD